MNWKIIYFGWILYIWFWLLPFRYSPDPNSYNAPLELCEISLWVIGSITTMVAIYHLYKKNRVEAALLLLLFLVPKMLVYIGGMEIVSETIFNLLGI